MRLNKNILTYLLIVIIGGIFINKLYAGKKSQGQTLNLMDYDPKGEKL